MIENLVFVLVLAAAIVVFYKSISRISRMIKSGKSIEIKDHPKERWKLMGKVAIGQSKMVARPLSAIFHIFVYVGFLVVNIEMIEILIDGVAGTHRVLSFTGTIYPVLISVFELFALSVILACAVFLSRRNIIRLKRFWNKEMTLWPRSDANIILITEILLMSAILIMNASDSILQDRNHGHYAAVGSFLVSGGIKPLLSGMSEGSLIFLERFTWWFHIVGVLIFLNYIPFSKHLHVFLAFPNVFYSKLGPKAKMAAISSITNEIRLMLNPSAEVPLQTEGTEIGQFGAKDVPDYTWKNLMDAFTCTECGRCTSSCPANITGKALSPRKIMMDVRDRAEELDSFYRKNPKDQSDGKSLLDKITTEEIWACTTCNACVQECPVNIDPVAVILELRRYLFLEKSAAPGELNIMFTNIENNGAPWQFSPEDRLKWAHDAGLEVPLMADLFSQGKKPEYLFWVGSSGAFDDRYKKVSVQFVKILNALKIDYAVLGPEETDTADSARRSGNEMLYQMQTLQIIELLKSYEVKKILTCCPHDFNTFKNEYPDFGGNFEVVHHSQFLSKLINEGKINLNSSQFKGKNITYHDPCYLGRGNGEYEAPRHIIRELKDSTFTEMKRNREFSLCCGAGGGQMFKEAEKGNKEVFIERIEDAIETKADIVATACPFCMVMMTDGIKYKNMEETMKNYDIAELVAIAMGL
ncbi:MAG: (Fe-S)-binding protein [Sphingobacteriia bacterium]|nr:(Fe-S)-binding protein [Sphingobacteriia bacterium]